MFKICDYEYENRTMTFVVDDTKTGAKYAASINLDKTQLLTLDVMCFEGAMINDGMGADIETAYDGIAENVMEYNSIINKIENIPILVRNEIRYELMQLRKPIKASDVENRNFGTKWYD